ncbi:MAG: discoidin domain-containing protein [Anaerolineales bacterium]
MALFEPDAAWTQAADRIQVFKLYGEWVGDDPWTIHASDKDLRQVISDLNQRGIALAMEAGPLEATSGCGQGIEGFGGGVRIGIRDAKRIKAAGGTLSYIALDEPFVFASLYNGPNAFQWPAERVAEKIDAYILGVRTVFPDLMIGDTKPLWGVIDVESYKNWLSTFRRVNGYDLAFFHLDVDFGRGDWAQAALELETFARELGIDFGIIYDVNPNVSSDEAWLTAAGEWAIMYELVANGQPDHVLFQSWHDHPTRTLPEIEPYTFTWFINAYFDDKASLVVRTKGLGANVAYGKQVTASHSSQAQPGGAVDGDPNTYLGAGDFAPQWIRIDLGNIYLIGGLRLLTSQSPTGETSHQVLVQGPEVEDAFSKVHTFHGVIADQQWL